MKSLWNTLCCLVGLFPVGVLVGASAQAADPVDLRDLDLQFFSRISQDYEAWARGLQQAELPVKEKLSGAIVQRQEMQAADHWPDSPQARLTKSQSDFDVIRGVPSPDLSEGQQKGPMLQIPLKAPWDFLSPFPDVSIGIQPLQAPRITLTGKLEANVLFAKKVMLGSCQLTEDDPIWQTQNEFKADFPEWAEGLTELLNLPLSFSLSGGQLNEAGATFDVGVVSGGLGVRPTPEHGDMTFEAFASGGVGMGTPSTLKQLFSASATVDAEVSALAALSDPVFGTPYGRQTLHGALAKQVQAAMLHTFTCPKCWGKGEQFCGICVNNHTITCPTCTGSHTITCSTCSDRRTVQCTRCQGVKHFTCGNCGGQGWRSCKTTESCSSCRGTGWDECMWCSGSGARQEEHSETRWRRVPRVIGFNEYGDPIEEYYDEPYTYTWYETITCSSCSGNGGERCGSCSASGTVTCSLCSGTGQRGCVACGGDGQVDCGRCDGNGTMTCRTCKGKPIRCPQCKGKPLRCPACKGKPKRCDFCQGKQSWGKESS